MSKIHPQARTTPRVRAEMQASPLSANALGNPPPHKTNSFLSKIFSQSLRSST
jgi:hypothetical protein